MSLPLVSTSCASITRLVYQSVCCHICWSRWSLLFTTSCLTRGVKHCDIRSFQSTSLTITPIARPTYWLPCTIIILAIAFLFPPLLLTIPSFLHAALVHQSLCVLSCCSLFILSTHSSIHLSCNQFISVLLHNSSVSSVTISPYAYHIWTDPTFSLIKPSMSS